MNTIINQLKYQNSNSYKQKVSADYALLANEVLGANNATDEELLRKITCISIYGRWLLLSEIFRIKQLKAVHFLHVPKTGGTTFGETLSRDKKAIVISVDAAPKTLLKQLMQLSNAKANHLVLTRAHHSLRLIKESVCIEHFTAMISAYRDPIDIHVSNVNMIMRRLARYASNEPMPEAETHFCKEWQALLPSKFEETSDYASQLANSEQYCQQMGNLYSRFFNMNGWKNLITSQQLIMIDADSFDNLFTEVFDYSSPPERKNVSHSPLLCRQMLTNSSISKLINKDKSISNFLSTHITLPSTLKDTFGQ